MAGQNDVTGDVLINKIGDKKAFDAGFDLIEWNNEKPKCEGCFTCDCETQPEKKEYERK